MKFDVLQYVEPANLHTLYISWGRKYEALSLTLWQLIPGRVFSVYDPPPFFTSNRF